MYEIHTRRRGWGWWARVVRTTPSPQHPAELDARLKVRVDEPPSRNSCLQAWNTCISKGWTLTLLIQIIIYTKEHIFFLQPNKINDFEHCLILDIISHGIFWMSLLLYGGISLSLSLSLSLSRARALSLSLSLPEKGTKKYMLIGSIFDKSNKSNNALRRWFDLNML